MIVERVSQGLSQRVQREVLARHIRGLTNATLVEIPLVDVGGDWARRCIQEGWGKLGKRTVTNTINRFVVQRTPALPLPEIR